MYRTQLLLQQLGIRQWIPQDQPTMVTRNHLLWRDQLADEILPPVKVNDALVGLESHTKPADINTLDTVNALVRTATSGDELHQHQGESASVHALNALDGIDNLENIYPATINFTCHILLHERFILIAQLSNEKEQRLLNNIQAACHASAFLLQWPLSIETWDMNDVVLQSYLAGVFAVHQEKVCFSLGDPPFELPMCYQNTVKNYASLQQLLESAEHKRALWQALYPYVYDAETNNA